MKYRLPITILGISIMAIILLWPNGWFNRNIEKRDFVDDLLGNAEVEVKDSDELEIVLVGDIMLSRHVGTQMTKAESWTLPFDDLAFELARADITFGNLESPFLDTKHIVSEGLVFKANPKATEGLTKAGFDVLSTANNHAFDQKLAGLTYTKQLLREKNILAIGTGTTTASSWQPAVFEVSNTKVAFLAASYASVNDGGRTTNDHVARIEDGDFLSQAINQLRQEVDIIIVSMHAGVEYTHAPNQQQIDFARKAIELGADVVVGHHPHWVQPVELYSPDHAQLPSPGDGEGLRERSSRVGLVLYSLGNFVFDQNWSQKTSEGLMVRIKIKDKQLETAKLVPIIIGNNCCARLANTAEADKILSDINATSTIDLRN